MANRQERTGETAILRSLGIGDAAEFDLSRYTRLVSPIRRLNLTEGKQYSMESDREKNIVTVKRIA